MRIMILNIGFERFYKHSNGLLKKCCISNGLIISVVLFTTF